MKRRHEVSLFEMLREPRHKDREGGVSGVDGIQLDREGSRRESARAAKSEQAREDRADGAGRRWFGRRGTATETAARGAAAPEATAPEADDQAPIEVSSEDREQIGEPDAGGDGTATHEISPEGTASDVHTGLGESAPSTTQGVVPRAELAGHSSRAELASDVAVSPTVSPAVSPAWVTWLNTGQRFRRATLVVLALGWIATLLLAYSMRGEGPDTGTLDVRYGNLVDAEWASNGEIQVPQKAGIRNIVSNGPVVGSDPSTTDTSKGSGPPARPVGEGYYVRCSSGEIEKGNIQRQVKDFEREAEFLERRLPLTATLIRGTRSFQLVVGYYETRAEAKAVLATIQREFAKDKKYPGNLFRDAYVPEKPYKKDRD